MYSFFVYSVRHALPMAGAQAMWEKGCTPTLTVLAERVKVANEGSGVANNCTSCMSSLVARPGVSQQCPGPSAVDAQLCRAVGVVTTHLAGYTSGAKGKLSVTHLFKKIFLFMGWLDPEETLALHC